MKRKLITLMALLLCVCSGAWAVDISDSFTVGSSAFTGANTVNGTYGSLAGTSCGRTGSRLKFSASGSLTFTPDEDYYISKVEYTWKNDRKPSANNDFSVTGGSITSAAGADAFVVTASDNCTSLVITNTSSTEYQTNGDAIVVTYVSRGGGSSYTVSYDGNGNTSGDAPTDISSPYASGSTVTVLGNTGSLAKTDHLFNGWNTAANGSGYAYKADDTFTITENTTLYAQWATACTVTYYGNENTGGSAPVDSNSPYASGSTVTVLGNTGSLVKTGYVFNGWNTKGDGSGNGYEAGEEFEISANTSLYAQWETAAAPSITTQPVNANVYKGDVATFTVVATGTPTPSYQWYECDDVEKTNAEAIDGAISASYSPSTAATGTTYYYVVVSNGIGDNAVSNVVSLTVSAVPTISWAFNDNSISTPPVISENSEKVKSTSVTLGSNVAFENSTDHCYVDSNGEDNVYVSRLKPSEASNNTVTFEVTLKNGVTFTPKSVSFVAMKQGTNGDVTLDAIWMTEDESDITLGTGLALKRASSSGTYATPGGERFSYNLTSKSAPEVTGKKFGLKLILNTAIKSYGIGEIIISGVLSGTPSVITHDITLSVADGQSSYGTVSPKGDEGVTQVEEGDDLEITANPVAAYKFEKWVIDDDENPVTTNPYTFENVTADHTAVASFLPRKTISYTVSESQKGTRTDVFGTEYADDDDHFTAPANKYLSSANQTLTGWSDGSKTTAVGGTIDCSGGNKTLTPVFTDNEGDSFAKTLEASKTDYSVTWQLGNNYSNFNVEQKTAYYVQQATINTKSVDIPMYINATSGKFNNQGDNTERAQVNNGTVLTLPVVNGSVVTVVAYHAFGTTDRNGNPCTQTKINGETTYDTSTNDHKTAIYTYSGSTGTIDIEVGGDAAWIFTINVTYPAPKYTITYSAGTGSGTVPTEASKNEGATFNVAGQGSMVAPTGCYFVGWNDGTANYAAGDTYTMGTTNVTLTAQWATSEETNHYHYSYKDATHYDGTTYTNPLGATADSGDNKALTDGNLCSSLGGITNVAIASAQYDGKGSYMNAYLKIATGGTSKVTITIADGYAGTLKLKAGGYSANPTITVSNSTKLSGSVGGVATTEDNFNELVYALTSGTHDIICSSKNMYISEFDLVTFSSVSGTITSAGWSTFASSYPLDLSKVTATSGATAYYASAASESTVTLTPTTATVQAGEGIMVKGTAGETFTIGVAASGAEIDGNLLKGQTTTGSVAASTAGAYHYVFGYESSSVYGFYNLASAATVPAGKAYLETEDELEPSAGNARISIVIDEDATGINNVKSVQKSNNRYYNLNGLEVAQPTKGLYIVNGKKVVIK